MTAVSNAAGIFHSFGYNFDDPNGHIQDLSIDTLEHLNTVPALITSEQVQDILNEDYEDYYRNPVQSILLSIRTNANTIYAAANTGNGVTNMANVRTSSSALSEAATSMLAHTNRLCGITPYDGLDSINPFLDMAMSTGRTAMYITNQTDGITNNAPIMGSFTSLMIEPQLIANNDILTLHTSNVVNSINMSFDIVLQQNVHTSNLTGTQITTINTHLNGLKNFIAYRQTSDVDFYSNVKRFIDAYNKSKKLNDLGETGNYLVMNLIGTEKAKARLS